jgi:hypothetical protein
VTMDVERAWSGRVANARPTDEILAALVLLGAATVAGAAALASKSSRCERDSQGPLRRKGMVVGPCLPPDA